MHLKKVNTFLGILLLCFAAMWLIFLVGSYLQSYFYVFPTVANPTVFITSTLVNLILPILLFLTVIYLFVRFRSVFSVVLCAVLSVLVCFFFFRSSAELLFSPSIVSFTNENKNFGIYDRELEKRLLLNPVPYFPESIPTEAEDIKYCYYYNYASSEMVYIVASWRYKTSNDLEIYLKELKLDPGEIFEEKAFFFTETWYKNVVIIDRKEKEICFIIATDAISLPQTISEALAQGTVLREP